MALVKAGTEGLIEIFERTHKALHEMFWKSVAVTFFAAGVVLVGVAIVLRVDSTTKMTTAAFITMIIVGLVLALIAAFFFALQVQATSRLATHAMEQEALINKALIEAREETHAAATRSTQDVQNTVMKPPTQ
jgi:hypothetical protein